MNHRLYIPLVPSRKTNFLSLSDNRPPQTQNTNDNNENSNNVNNDGIVIAQEKRTELVIGTVMSECQLGHTSCDMLGKERQGRNHGNQELRQEIKTFLLFFHHHSIYMRKTRGKIYFTSWLQWFSFMARQFYCSNIHKKADHHGRRAQQKKELLISWQLRKQ